MARIRTVKPEFWSSPDTGDVSRDARLLFIGLWNFADDAGRLEVVPRTILGDVFPHDLDVTAEDVARWLDELAASGLISLYRQGRRTYLQVTGWDHQRIDTPSKPRCPDPEDCESLDQISAPTAPALVEPPTDPPGDTPETPEGPAGESRGRNVGASERRSVGSVGDESPKKPARKPPKNHDHQQLFQALAKACGVDPSKVPRSEGSKYGKCAKELHEISATPRDVLVKARRYRELWPQVSLTPTALVNQWGQVDAKPGRDNVPDDACRDCGQQLDKHDPELCEILAKAG